MAVRLTNNATSLLAGAIDAAATTLSVENADAGKFPNPAAGDWFPLTIVDNANNMEVLKATARVGAIITVERAQEGTTAKAFAAGSRVDLRLTSSAMLEVVPTAMEAADYANDGFDNADSRFFWFDTVARKLKRASWSGLVTALYNTLGFMKRTGDTASGEISTTSVYGFRIKGAASAALSYYDSTAWYLMFSDTPTGGFSALRPLRINKADGLVTMGHGLGVTGNITASNVVYAGNGSAIFNTDGNSYGSIWNQWGSPWAWNAINARIEQRAMDWANQQGYAHARAQVVEFADANRIALIAWNPGTGSFGPNALIAGAAVRYAGLQAGGTNYDRLTLQFAGYLDGTWKLLSYVGPLQFGGPTAGTLALAVKVI